MGPESKDQKRHSGFPRILPTHGLSHSPLFSPCNENLNVQPPYSSFWSTLVPVPIAPYPLTMGEELGIWWEMVHLSPVHCEVFEKDWMYFVLLRRIRLPPNITENFVVKRLCAPQGFIKSPSTRLLPKHHKGFACAHLSPATQTQGSSVYWHLPVLRQPLNLPTHTCQQRGCHSCHTLLLRKDDGGGNYA